MQNGYYQATGAMVTQFNRLDVISNNLANVNTTAFKRDDVVVGDFFRILKESRGELPLENHTKEGAKFLNRSIDRVPQIVERYIEFSAGGLKQSSNPLDFALKRNDLFFLVETPNGIKMTQDGSFVLDNKGVLTTKDGYPVLPEEYFRNGKYIEIPPNATLTSDKSGNLYANGEQLAKFFIAQNSDLKSLQKDGENYYKIDDIADIDEIEEGDYVAQGFLLTGNVNAVKEMVSLIEVNRFVEMYQKVMSSHMNDINGDAINKLASLKA